MIKEVEVSVRPEELTDETSLLDKVGRKCNLSPKQVRAYEIVRRSLDARREPRYRLRVRIFTGRDRPPTPILISDSYRDVSDGPVVHIVGAGPAGYFAALECLKWGIKPVVLERGKDVRARRRDLRAIQQFGKVDQDSNYCFGEGGAGTYSDGKLYTRSKKRGSVEEILKTLVEHGAKTDIMVDAHPHIGSNKLPQIITSIRHRIEAHGGEVHFEHRVTGLVVRKGRIEALQINGDDTLPVEHVILATGHSARDIYQILFREQLRLEEKPFALGVRVEHPQAMIDKFQYGKETRPPELPAAAYRLATEVKGRGVYSFCMCPGGLVVPASTAPGELVVNGMSMSRRDSRYANAGVVVSVYPEDWHAMGFNAPLGGVRFQEMIEQRLFNASDGTQRAPAQRLTDFVQGQCSVDLPDSSYIPGLISVPLHELLPDLVYRPMVAGIKVFESKMKGYLTEQAIVLGVESRTSSPVRIPRDPQTMQHPQVHNMYPSGEGAGYAGGIVSAAIDGQLVVRAIALNMKVRGFLQ